MDFPKMEVLAVWTKHGQHADYLCLEPWHGMPARSEDIGPFEDKLFVTLLQPGHCYKAWFTMSFVGA